MVQFAQLLGAISAVLLLVALGTWLNLFRGPMLRPIDGRVRLSKPQVQLGSKLLVLATGLSAIAAVVAVAGWFAS